MPIRCRQSCMRVVCQRAAPHLVTGPTHERHRLPPDRCRRLWEQELSTEEFPRFSLLRSRCELGADPFEGMFANGHIDLSFHPRFVRVLAVSRTCCKAYSPILRHADTLLPSLRDPWVSGLRSTNLPFRRVEAAGSSPRPPSIFWRLCHPIEVEGVPGLWPQTDPPRTLPEPRFSLLRNHRTRRRAGLSPYRDCHIEGKFDALARDIVGRSPDKPCIASSARLRE